MNHFKKWLWMAGTSLMFTGAGACMIADAALVKSTATDIWAWVPYGSLALIVFNTGLCLLGGAIIHRVHHELEHKK